MSIPIFNVPIYLVIAIRGNYQYYLIMNAVLHTYISIPILLINFYYILRVWEWIYGHQLSQFLFSIYIKKFFIFLAELVSETGSPDPESDTLPLSYETNVEKCTFDRLFI